MTDAAYPHKAVAFRIHDIFDVPSELTSIDCVMQGADNFQKEFKQLRRSFRFNEYKEIREQNPPTNPFARVS